MTWRAACRLQLRGQPRHWPARQGEPHRVPVWPGSRRTANDRESCKGSQGSAQGRAARAPRPGSRLSPPDLFRLKMRAQLLPPTATNSAFFASVGPRQIHRACFAERRDSVAGTPQFANRRSQRSSTVRGPVVCRIERLSAASRNAPKDSAAFAVKRPKPKSAGRGGEGLDVKRREERLWRNHTSSRAV